MEIKSLKLKKIKPDRITTPQCCVKVTDANSSYTYRSDWRQKHYGQKRPSFDPQRCQLESTHQIGLKNYCRSHASKALLELYENGKISIHETDGQVGNQRAEDVAVNISEIPDFFA